MWGPSGALRIAASSSSSEASEDHLLDLRGLELAHARHAAHRARDLGEELFARDSHGLAAGVDEVAVRRELQGRAIQLARHRLGPVQLPLEQHLASYAEALPDERLALDRLARLAR